MMKTWKEMTNLKDYKVTLTENKLKMTTNNSVTKNKTLEKKSSLNTKIKWILSNRTMKKRMMI